MHAGDTTFDKYTSRYIILSVVAIMLLGVLMVFHVHVPFRTAPGSSAVGRKLGSVQMPVIVAV